VGLKWYSTLEFKPQTALQKKKERKKRKRKKIKSLVFLSKGPIKQIMDVTQ
jgi:hypothetical protein